MQQQLLRDAKSLDGSVAAPTDLALENGTKEGTIPRSDFLKAAPALVGGNKNPALWRIALLLLQRSLFARPCLGPAARAFAVQSWSAGRQLQMDKAREEGKKGAIKRRKKKKAASFHRLNFLCQKTFLLLSLSPRSTFGRRAKEDLRRFIGRAFLPPPPSSSLLLPVAKHFYLLHPAQESARRMQPHSY